MTKFFTIDLEEPCDGFGTGLKCPSCGESNLHQGAVNVWNRAQEDSNTGLAACIDGQEGYVGKDERMTGNPSFRRDGMTIDFSCEHCEGGRTLAIFQHKGTTYLKWTKVFENVAG